MPPSDDSAQVITTTGSGSSSCNIPSTSCTNDDSTRTDATILSTNSSALVENTDTSVSIVLENDLVDPEDKTTIETPQDTTVNETSSTCVSKKASEEEEKEQHHDREEQATTTQENACSEDAAETTTTKGTEGTTEEDTASQKADVSDKEVDGDSSKDPEPKSISTSTSSTEQDNADSDIEWLKPRNNIETEEEDGSAKPKGKDSAYKMLKKGAVGAVGGTILGLGLVMIPLPTPFGAVVASSGLAVLGTEFKEAKVLNDRLVGSAKGHFNKARDSVVKGIEKMNEDESDSDSDISVSSNNNNDNNNKTHIDGDENSVKRKEERGETGPVIKVNSVESLGSESNIDGTATEDSETSESGDTTSESLPMWLHMNPIERNRQAKLAKAKYRKDKQTSYEQAMEAFTKGTGKLLSRTILPLIKKKNKSSAEAAVQEETADGIDTSSVTEKGENNLQTKNEGKTNNTTPETNEEEFRESSTTIKTNDNNSDGYVVISQEES